MILKRNTTGLVYQTRRNFNRVKEQIAVAWKLAATIEVKLEFVTTSNTQVEA